MKKSAILAFIILFSLTVFAQKTRPTKKGASVLKTKATVVNGEKDEFEKAVSEPNSAERIMALNKFVESFPQSEEKIHALELIVSARAAIADEKLRSGDAKNGVGLFTLAVRDAPQPISDKLFSEILLQIPTNLYIRGQQAAAVEIAKLIELKIETNAAQMLGLATFYISTENAGEARRLAEKVIQINPTLPTAYQTLGLASRVNFQLDEAAGAYAKALELDANSIVSKRSLAEMKRATGKQEEAIALYREILAKDEADASAQTGLALSLFDANQKVEAETETAKILDQNPGNLPLLVGAAYWYAAHNNGTKAVEFAQKAIAVEPRYTWSYIALARGLILQKNPLEAEKALLTAKQYGNFPTLDYEIASARLAAGFYREAAETLSKRFALKDGVLETKLGGRVPVTADNFTDLLSLERRASIFEPFAADSAENSERVKRLLDFTQKINNANTTDAAISEAADEFVKGDDRMKFHRQIFTANRLLDAKKDFPKVLELTGAATGGVDRALEVSSPSAAVLADELYNSRQLAMLRGQLIIVPDVPQRTLSNILRGRIEDISGWTLYEQGKTDEAVIHLKRAVSVLPEKSSYWRDTMWRLGTALDSEGKSKEALDTFIKSYDATEPSAAKHLAIETIYRKINGNLEGLDAKIGESPVNASNASPIVSVVAPVQQPTPTEQIAQVIPKQIPVKRTVLPLIVQRTLAIVPPPTPEPTPAIEASTSPETKMTPEVTPEIIVTPTLEPIVVVEPKATPTPELTFTPTPEITATPEPTPEITPTPESSPETKILPEKTASPEVTPELKPTPEPTPELITDIRFAPTPEPITEQVAQIEPLKKPLAEGNLPNSRAVLVSPLIVVTEEMPPVVVKKPQSKLTKAQNPMFESVIINVPKTETVQPIIKSGAQLAGMTNSVRTIRPRFAPETNSSGLPEQTAQCKIVVGQENISIINNGGNIGILAGYEKDGDLTQLTATSDSPSDVEVALEPEIGAQSGRAFFIVRSISTRVGIYNVAFDAPCGRKTIVVKVR